MSYDTTGNSIIIPVSMKIVKLTTTLKNKRLIKLEKKTMMLSIFCLETKLLRLLKKVKLLVWVNVKTWQKEKKYREKTYRKIGKKQVMVKETPPKDSIKKFWKGIWGEKKACNMSAGWIGNMEKGNEKVKEQEWET